ncbi:hypothetical protein ACSAZK_08370 [Methanosarcina sp. Mfa9]|uniref:hypothetical protein n=1 Tax=Methanosarcina sp. Mfa9 TaxID=3439063 RepID=UPI003F83E91E
MFFDMSIKFGFPGGLSRGESLGGCRKPERRRIYCFPDSSSSVAPLYSGYLVENNSPVQFYAGLESFSGEKFFLRLKIFNELI